LTLAVRGGHVNIAELLLAREDIEVNLKENVILSVSERQVEIIAVRNGGGGGGVQILVGFFNCLERGF
jgi:hypothetical protein